MAQRILVVDDEPQIVRVLRTTLESNGYLVSIGYDGAAALEIFQKTPHDLVITDLAMPKMDGLELTRAIRLRSRAPIIVLSVRDAEAMKVSALDEGADDYMTKPFGIQELLARVRVHLRRGGAVEQPVASLIEAGDFVVDVDRHQVLLGGVEVHLTPKEFDLLVVLARSAYRVLTHKVLLRAVWGPGGDSQPEYLRVLVAQLRKKIEREKGEPRYIRNEPWVGYRFTPSGELTDS